MNGGVKMRKIIYLSIVIFTFTFFFALCKPEEEVTKIMENGIEVIVNRLEPYKIKKASTEMQLQKELSIDTENFKDEDIISIRSIEADSVENIYILDDMLRKIIIFDKKGNFLGTIGREGKGPGEFQMPVNLIINSKDEIIVFDSLNHKFSFFKKDGALIKENRDRGKFHSFALPHHRAYGSVHGGSCHLRQRVIMTGKGKETSFGKETVRHGHLDGFHVRYGPRAFTGECHGQGALFADTKITQASITRAAFLNPLVHDKTSHPAANPPVELFKHIGSFNQPVITEPPSQVGVQFLNNLSHGDSPGPACYPFDTVLYVL